MSGEMVYRVLEFVLRWAVYGTLAVGCGVVWWCAWREVRALAKKRK